MRRPRARASNLSPYPELIDLCHARDYRVHLEHGKKGWVLSVFEDGDLIARGTSSNVPPHCFPELGARAAAGLHQSGKGRRQ